MSVLGMVSGCLGSETQVALTNSSEVRLDGQRSRVCMTDMYGHKKPLCAAGGGVARDVFSIVRDSRMWCLHGIGRDSWVWGEQEALEVINSPHKMGDETLT